MLILMASIESSPKMFCPPPPLHYKRKGRLVEALVVLSVEARENAQKVQNPKHV